MSRFVNDNTDVVVKDGNGIASKKFKSVKVNEAFCFKKDKSTVAVAIKGLENDEVLFTETDWGRVFDYLMTI